MALPYSGVMSLNMIKGEFGQSGPVTLSRYYRAGGLVPNTPRNYNISTYGRISHSMFHGASKELNSEELVQFAWDGRGSFSRFAPAAVNSAWPDGWWQNTSWAKYTDYPNIGYNFYNDGFEEIDAWCTVVVSHNSNNPTIQVTYMTDIFGNGVGYSQAASIKTSPSPMGFRLNTTHMVVYHVNIDRRRLRSIGMYNVSGGHLNECQQQTCFVLPGRQSVINAWQHNGTTSFYIRRGEVVHTAQGRAWEAWGDFINHPYRLNAGLVWYNGNCSSLMFGLDERWYSVDMGRNALGSTGLSLKFRKLMPGESAAQWDNMNGILTRGTARGPAFAENQSNGGILTWSADALVFSASMPDEMLTVTGFSITSSNVPANAISYSVGPKATIYPNCGNPQVRAWIGQAYYGQAEVSVPFNMSGTLTVRTASGRTMSTGWSLSGRAYCTWQPPEQTGGE